MTTSPLLLRLALLGSAALASSAQAAPPLSSADAIALGQQYCQTRRYTCENPAVERLGNFWRVRYEMRSAQLQGPLYLDYDVGTRALVRADEPRPMPQQARPVPAPPPAAVPAPAPAPVRMSRDEAVSRSLESCRELRFQCRLVSAGLDGDVWLVELDARRGRLAGPLHLGFDAWSRALVAVNEPEEPRLMTPAEATARGYEVCSEHGYQCRLLGSTLASNVWRLDLEARRGPLTGPLHVELDGFTRAVLRLDEPRPPPPPRLMTFDEATARGLQLCSERGYQCRPIDAALASNVWRLEIDARRADAAGRLHVELDALTRAVLRLDEPRPPPPGPRAMSYEEATEHGIRVCSERGYQCRFVDGALAENVWRLDLDARRADAEGRLHVELDAFTRAVLRIDEPRPVAPAPPPRAMRAREAGDVGLAWCDDHGYDCRVQKTKLVRGGTVWQVRLAVDDPRGQVRLELDAFTRAVLDAKENVRGPR